MRGVARIEVDAMRDGDVLFRVLMAAGGFFSIVCAALDLDWFMNHSKAWLFVKLFGRDGARVFYILLGLAAIAMALLL